MKHLLILSFVALFAGKAAAQKIVAAKDAHKYAGKEVIVEGKLCNWGDSGYGQFATFDIGTDIAPKQLTVVSQGRNYSYSKARTWVGHYLGRTVLIKGVIMQPDTIGVWMNMTDTIRLKP